MIKIIEELTIASEHLRAALRRYTSICSSLQGCHVKESIIGSSVSRELSDRLDRELLQASSYEASIEQAKAALRISRNHTLPVNSLPSEILGHIFQLVVDAHPCRLLDVDNLKNPPSTDLDMVLSVCARWRQVAITSQALWSHLDILLGRRSTERFLARAEAYAARARECFLDIHIVSASQTGRAEYIKPNFSGLTQLLTTIVTRVRSLNIKTEIGGYGSMHLYYCIFERCFGGPTLGLLTQLTIESQENLGSKFIKTADYMDDLRGVVLDLPAERLEDIWLPAKVLRLKGLYPLWTSGAYHGLVELRLLTDPWDIVHIDEPQLVNILEASPALHTFHFSLKIIDSLPDNYPVVAVQLKELKVLVWNRWSSGSGELSNFLRWLAPGSRPLQLTIQGYSSRDDVHSQGIEGHIKDFFARSNVVELDCQGWDISSSQVSELLGLNSSVSILLPG